MTSSAVWFAPGRVNLIGEHTDYNDGWTLPFALPIGCTAHVEVGGDRWLASSAQQPESVDLAVGTDLRTSAVPTWARYVLGAASLLAARGMLTSGVSVQVDSRVPLGAGLSSSAAVVCAVSTALLDAAGVSASSEELLALARAVENDVVGAPTGGMDQLASLRGVAGHALLCDMRELSAEPVPFDLARHGLELLVVDTHTPHANVVGEYARRRAECARAADLLGVGSLRDAGPADLPRIARSEAGEVLLRRARHVVTENARVQEVGDLLRGNRPRDIGPLLSASHASMRDDFEITVPRVDAAAQACEAAGALGARMTGGGFGGSVVALVERGTGEDCVARVRAAYAAAGFDETVPGWVSAFVATAGQGARSLG